MALSDEMKAKLFELAKSHSAPFPLRLPVMIDGEKQAVIVYENGHIDETGKPY